MNNLGGGGGGGGGGESMKFSGSLYKFRFHGFYVTLK